MLLCTIYSKFNFQTTRSQIMCLFIIAFMNLYCKHEMGNDLFCESYYNEEIQDSVYTLISTMPECTSCDSPDIESAIQYALITMPIDKDAYGHTFFLEIIIGKNGKVLIARILDEEINSSLMYQQFIKIIKQTTWKPAQCNNSTVNSRFVIPVSITIDSD